MIGSDVVARSAVQAKRGTKQTCRNETCGSQYYDLRRVPPACPYCGASCDAPAIIKVDFESLGKQRPYRTNRRVQPTRPPVEVSKIHDDQVEAADEQAENEPAISSAAEDLLIEIEDDDEVEAPIASTNE
jgi:uncharacterized protein (TIGR02300 family)